MTVLLVIDQCESHYAGAKHLRSRYYSMLSIGFPDGLNCIVLGNVFRAAQAEAQNDERVHNGPGLSPLGAAVFNCVPIWEPASSVAWTGQRLAIASNLSICASLSAPSR